MWVWIGLVAVAFLCGSIPFGLLIARRHGIDIRAHGSGNIGATNVRRTLGRGPGSLCLSLDIGKGLVPSVLAGVVGGGLGRVDIEAATAWWWLAVVAAAVLGHVLSPWVGGRGGKGVATGFGAMLGVFPVLTVAAAAALAVWAVSVRLTRYVGLSSCLASASLPVWVAGVFALVGDGAWSAGSAPFLVVTGALAVLVIFKHRGNLRRTVRGTEPRVGDPPSPSGT